MASTVTKSLGVCDGLVCAQVTQAGRPRGKVPGSRPASAGNYTGMTRELSYYNLSNNKVSY